MLNIINSLGRTPSNNTVEVVGLCRWLKTTRITLNHLKELDYKGMNEYGNRVKCLCNLLTTSKISNNILKVVNVTTILLLSQMT